MSFNLSHKLSLSAADVQRIYLKHGTEIKLEEAEKILEFIAKLTNIAIDQVLREEQNINISPPIDDSISQDNSIY